MFRILSRSARLSVPNARGVLELAGAWGLATMLATPSSRQPPGFAAQSPTRLDHWQSTVALTQVRTIRSVMSRKLVVKDEAAKLVPATASVASQDAFGSLGLSAPFIQLLNQMGIYTPTSVQKLAITGLLQGNDALVGAQTGTGKTLSYLLPIVQQIVRDEKELGIAGRPGHPRALVLVPSRELALQVVAVAKSLCHHPDARFRAAITTGGSSKHRQAQVLAGVKSRKVLQQRQQELRKLRDEQRARIQERYQQLLQELLDKQNSGSGNPDEIPAEKLPSAERKRELRKLAEEQILKEDEGTEFAKKLEAAKAAVEESMTSRNTPIIATPAKSSVNLEASGLSELEHHNVDLLVSTPRRLRDLLDSGKVSMSDVRYIAIDEADFLLAPNNGFVEDLECLLQPVVRRLQRKYAAELGHLPASHPLSQELLEARKDIQRTGGSPKAQERLKVLEERHRNLIQELQQARERKETTKEDVPCQFIWIGASVTKQMMTAVEKFMPLYSDKFRPRSLLRLHDDSQNILPKNIKLVWIRAGNHDKAEILTKLLDREEYRLHPEDELVDRSLSERSRKGDSLPAVAITKPELQTKSQPSDDAGDPIETKANQFDSDLAASQSDMRTEAPVTQDYQPEEVEARPRRSLRALRSQSRPAPAPRPIVAKPVLDPKATQEDGADEIEPGTEYELQEDEPSYSDLENDFDEEGSEDEPGYKKELPISPSLLTAAQLAKLQSRPCVMVFCNSIAACRFVEHTLRSAGIAVVGAHGAIPPKLRALNWSLFFARLRPVLVCTDLASRGVDTRFVNHVVNFDMPSGPISFLHRAGRTARAGSSGQVTSILERGDVVLARAIDDAHREGRPITSLSGDKDLYRTDVPKALRRGAHLVEGFGVTKEEVKTMLKKEGKKRRKEARSKREAASKQRKEEREDRKFTKLKAESKASGAKSKPRRRRSQRTMEDEDRGNAVRQRGKEGVRSLQRQREREWGDKQVKAKEELNRQRKKGELPTNRRPWAAKK